jgi:hypothetical protein
VESRLQSLQWEMGSSPEGGMMAILRSQSAHATVKRMQSRPSGMTLVSTGLRRHVGSASVEPAASSRSGRGRALVRNRIGEVPTLNGRFARRRPPQCGWKGLGRGPAVARMPQSSFRKGGVIAVQSIGHQDRVSPEIARSLQFLLLSGSLSGFTGRAPFRDVPRRRGGRRSKAHRILGEEAA